MTDLAHRVVARTIRIDQDAIQKLRKDFLLLAKNIPRVKSYKQAAELREAFKIFRKRFNRIYFDEFLNKQLKYDETVQDAVKEWQDRELRKAGWSFYLALGEFPMGYPDGAYRSKEGEFIRFNQERKKWDGKLKRLARDLWKALDSFLRDLGRDHYDVPTTNVDQIEVEGFKVRVVGDIDDGLAGSWEQFRKSLRILKKRAAKVFPPMLRLMLPIHAQVIGGLDVGGRYKRNHIEISMTAAKRPERLAQIIAHEMGHHIYKVYLGQNDRKFWDTAIRGNYGPLDVEKALKLWPDGAWLHEMGEKLKDTDPTLAIQLELIGFGHGGRSSISKKEDFEAALARGEQFPVPQNPITGYAGKNPEEAFCEALSMLMGYGPKTVDPLVRHWLQMVLPNLRVASQKVNTMHKNSSMAERVAARYKDKKKVPSQDGGETTVYVYSERQIADRNRKKADRLKKLGKNIKKLRSQVKRDLKSSDPSTRLTALAVALMDETAERIGNDSSAADGHFGVTGWQKKHMDFSPNAVTIKYVGKSGVKQEKTITDAGVRKALKEAYDSLKGGGDTCVLSWDDGCITAEKVNEYLKPFSISAKDIRGYHANSEMRKALKKFRKGALPSDKKEREKKLKEEFKQALEETAKAVGHEASTLKNQYLVPGLEDSYLKDGTIA